MKSKQLTALGLQHFVAGAAYNVRTNQSPEQWVNQVQRILVDANMQPRVLYSADQVHGAHVAYAEGTNGKPYHFGRYFEATDGLLTDQKGVALLIKYADCTPIVLYDAVRQVQAIVHSGWRSTVQRISQKAIEQMVTQFGCQREQIVAFLGPTIDCAHYEVGSEVYEAFANFKQRDAFFEREKEKYHLDMAGANKAILLEAGILPEHVEVLPCSTYTTPTLHSARREGANYQLNALVTMLPSDEA
ncbi:peptidoglycan editing factor PgeF [Aerococcaceae bacterium NML190073]|nr:peptidoglycan editing factor PgeF [Aerococcaceae bacterium NML190073]MCW6666928.1 peptidoglycan editing factor PgeF [Aerococcaceae bacterium NML190938]MCW6680898.1 peptidoglycan editing factor PgeF [Aerococcaceae bacterium NML130460]